MDQNSLRRTCEQCQGTLLWDAAAAALRCQGCGALHTLLPDEVIAEHDLAEALRQGHARGRLGSGARQLHCHECHAEVELPDELQATRCEFCGSAQVWTQSAAEDHYRPESLVPFGVDRAAAERGFRAWLAERWLCPSDLAVTATLHELRGVYIPYWAFGCEVTSRWSAAAGYTEWRERPTKEGPRREAHVRWQPCSGQRHDAYEDHLVCASRGLDAGLAAAQRFDLRGLLPYAPEYLLGFSAERYAVALATAWGRAREQLGALQERRCAADVPGDTQRSLRATHQFQAVRFKHVLLPQWVAAYRYRGRVFRFLVNGQTGVVSGVVPRSVVKVTLLALLVLLAVAGVIFLIYRANPPAG